MGLAIDFNARKNFYTQQNLYICKHKKKIEVEKNRKKENTLSSENSGFYLLNEIMPMVHKKRTATAPRTSEKETNNSNFKK